MIRNLIALTALLLLSAVVASAQTAAPPVQHFVISATTASYNAGSGANAVAIVSTGFQLTTNVSVAYDRVSNPADSKQPILNLGDFNYTRELRALLGSKLSSKLAFDSSNWLVTFQGSAGKATAPGVNTIAEGGGIYLTRPMGNNVAFTTGYRVFHANGVTKLFKVPLVGINFTF